MGDWPALQISKFAQDDVAPSTYGTTVNASASAHTKGTWTQLVAAAPVEVAGLLLQFQFDQNRSYLVDIGIGATAAEQVVFPNMPFLAPGLTIHTIAMRYVPLSIRRGERIALRMQASTGSSLCRVKLQMLGESLAGIRPPSRWEAWGADTATSSGTVVTSAIAAHAKGAWAQLIAAAGIDARMALLTLLSGTIDDIAIDLGLGTTPVIENISTTNEFQGLWAPFPWRVPRGAQVQARLAAAGGASHTTTLVLHGGG